MNINKNKTLFIYTDFILLSITRLMGMNNVVWKTIPNFSNSWSKIIQPATSTIMIKKYVFPIVSSGESLIVGCMQTVIC